MTVRDHSPTVGQERAALESAAHWYARLNADHVADVDRQDWQRWLQASPLNQSAWQKVERVCLQMQAVPAPLARATFEAPQDPGRRRLMRNLALVVPVTSLGWLGWQLPPWTRWRADYATQVGERRSVLLPDGSRLLLNTDSAIDLAFDAQRRLLYLRQGEVLIDTSPDPAGRPFEVWTRHGRLRALGTHFTVRLDERETRLQVLEKAVEVHAGQRPPVRLDALQQVRFDTQGVGPIHELSMDEVAWREGSLIVRDKPLVELLEELRRYHPGYLGCADELAMLKVSGAFPLDDIELGLKALSRSFPLKIQRFTRYWLKLVAA